MKNVGPQVLLFLTSVVMVFGQSSGTSASGGDSNMATGWRGILSIDYKEKNFIVPYSRIVSVSQHEFLIDGGVVVREVTVDTSGQVVARFYYLETAIANSSLESAKTLTEMIKDSFAKPVSPGGGMTPPVIKHYPVATHAKTVEFSVSDREHLKMIFEYITRKWLTENGRGDAEVLRIP